MLDEARFGNTYGFFYNTDGGSWHGEDIEVILWMRKHWLMVTTLGFVTGFSVIGALWLLIRKVSHVNNGYKLLDRIA